MSNNILLIDDDPQFRKILEIRLKSFLTDLTISHCISLDETRKLLKSVPSIEYDLVILDQHLPDGRGSDLLTEGAFVNMAVLCMSSDSDPNLPGQTVLAGANFFLSKVHASEPLFRPLVEGLIDRNKIQRELIKIKTQAAVMESVRTLVMTLKHEINNPLGALMGGAYILGGDKNASQEQLQAVRLVEQSGQRIKQVLEQLCSAVSLESVSKGGHTVFQVPGDKKWGQE
jgi:signal transduction histidine kinase